MEHLITLLASFFLLFEPFALGFWFLVTLAFITYTCSTVKNQYGFASFLTFILACIYGKSIWHLIQQTGPLPIGILILGYFVLGGIVSLVSWRNYVREVVKEYNRISRKDEYYIKSVTSPAFGKSKIIGWILLWPFCLFWMIFHDYLNKIAQSVYNLLAGLYQKIADNELKKIHHNESH